MFYEFLLGIGVGVLLIHVMYVCYFHFCILGKIENVVLESREWLDNIIHQPGNGKRPSILSTLISTCTREVNTPNDDHEE